MKKYLVIILLFIPLRLLSQVQDSSALVQGNKDCCSLIHHKDSIISNLYKENVMLRMKEGRADSLVVRIMNLRLMSRFQKDNVTEAISDYNRISDPVLKAKYKYRETLLKSYEGYYRELSVFLNDIQQDAMRVNIFQPEDYISKCKSGMKRLSYYRFYIGNDGKQKIPYLDRIFSRIEHELSKHGEKDKRTGRVYSSNFDFIIEELTN